MKSPGSALIRSEDIRLRPSDYGETGYARKDTENYFSVSFSFMGDDSAQELLEDRMAITRLSLAGLLVATIGGAAFAQSSGPSSVVGVWRVSEVMSGGPNPRPMASSTGIVIFTQRHYSISQVTSDKPRPELPPRKEATDKQRADAYEPFTGQAGTYEIHGNEMTVRPAVSMNPNLMRAGSFTTMTFIREGNTLSVAFKADENGPLRNKITMKYTLVE